MITHSKISPARSPGKRVSNTQERTRLSDLAVFRGMLQAAFDCPAKHLAEVRATLAGRLNRTREPIPYVNELLRWCLRRRSEGGLTLATDVLSTTGELAMEFARQFQGKDAARWSTQPTIEYHPNDDIWRILLVAASRASESERDRLGLLRGCLQARHRGIREAVVEGLGELATLSAKAVLKLLAGQDPDSFIRDLARLTLSDFDGE